MWENYRCTCISGILQENTQQWAIRHNMKYHSLSKSDCKQRRIHYFLLGQLYKIQVLGIERSLKRSYQKLDRP